MPHESHSLVLGPAPLAVVAHNVFVVWIWILREELLDEVARIFLIKHENDVNFFHVSHVHSNGVAHLHMPIRKASEFIGKRRCARKICRAGEAEYEKIEHEAIELLNKGRKLESTNETDRIYMIHVLERKLHVILCRDVVCNVMVDDEAQQPIQHGKIYSLAHLVELRLNEHDSLAL